MLKKISVVSFAAALVFVSTSAFADYAYRHEPGPDFSRRERGRVVHRLPPGCRPIVARGASYFYRQGLFYQYTPAGYVIIEAPRGAVVSALPHGYRTIYIQRTPYYVYDDTYYVAQGQGAYAVVAPPAPEQLKSAVPAPDTVQTGSKAAIDEYEIYIPNDNGSYTLVIIKKTEKGFTGPQGEFYPEHPTVEQLKAMYTKK